MKNKLVIVDGNSLMNRAYYAIQRPMITKEGLYTHGIYGFLNMLNKIISDYEPTHIAVAFDRKAPTFRHLEYREYKAGRKKMPPELAMQFPVLKDILQALNIGILEMDGFEADDILGTISLSAEEAGFESYIFTGDKDAFQLASDFVKIIFTKRGITEFDIYDKCSFIEKYGFTPLQFIDLKGLMGDSSDNIPGIPGVGEKTATKLILEYGSVEKLIESVNELKAGKLKTNIEENAQQALMSKRLATINRHIPIEYNFDELLYREPNYDKLIELYKKLEFNTFLKKLVNSANKKLTEKNNSDYIQQGITYLYSDIPLIKEDADIQQISSKEEISELLETALIHKYIWLHVFHDNNHIEAPYISSVAVGFNEKIFLLRWSNELAMYMSDFIAKYKGKFCGHNLKKSYYALIRCCILSVNKNSESIFKTAYDTEIAAYLIDAQKKSYDLSSLMLDYFHEAFPSDKEIHDELSAIDMFGNEFETQAEIAKKIFSATCKILSYQADLLEQRDVLKLYKEVELPLIEVLASMEYLGMKADSEALSEIGDKLKSRVSELTSMIYSFAGEEFNINSPKQLGVILFEKLHLSNGKKNKTGYSTNVSVLESIIDEHPIIPLIIEYRMLTKLTGTYVDGLIPLIGKDGKIHAHFQQSVTSTGRLSCTEPNLQNIPVRQATGRMLRKIFTASEKDNILIGADYSQVELRIMAHLSEDPSLTASFIEGADIHRATAARVFNVKPDEVTTIQRSSAKAVNFGVIYGISSFGLAGDLKISRKEAQNYIDEYFSKHPKVKEYMDSCVEECKNNGYVTTILGRRRYINEIHSSNYMTRQLGERLAMNTPVQGSASDIIKIAMINVYHELNKKGLASRLILQVHDELILDSPESEADEASALLKKTMEQAFSLKVPLTVDINTAQNWYNLK